VHGQEMPPAAMQELIGSLGRIPRQRSTLYGPSPLRIVAAAPTAPALACQVRPVALPVSMRADPPMAELAHLDFNH